MDSPKTLIEFMEMYKTEEDCRQVLFEHRWPDGFCCPSCGHDQAYAHKKRSLFQCTACRHQASVTAGTIMKGTRTDLRKWFLAIYLLAITRKPLSFAELARQLGIAAVTAWTMRRKIMHAMSRREGELMLVGVVEMDESYEGGARSGIRGRGAEGKTPVAVMAQQNESGGCSLAHIQVIDDISGLSLGDAATSHVTPGSIVATDGWPAYGKLASLGYVHEPLVVGGADASELFPWVHKFCYRLNRRSQRQDLFRRILNRCLLYTGPATYALLTAA